jgi:hypothetical protein
MVRVNNDVVLTAIVTGVVPKNALPQSGPNSRHLF